jgi:hypothetical protein
MLVIIDTVNKSRSQIDGLIRTVFSGSDENVCSGSEESNLFSDTVNRGREKGLVLGNDMARVQQ